MCSVCGINYTIDKSREGTSRFCSRECMAIGRTGEKSSLWKPRKVVICPFCKTPFEVSNKTKNQKYCSLPCFNRATKKYAGENNQNWKGGKAKLICQECGKSYEIKRCHSFGSKHCSLKCHNIAIGKRQRGEKHPNWKGGISRYPYGFDFNKELKELVRKRDGYKCQLCGAPQEECFKKLSIHHIDYNKENSNPTNLITVCNKCNSKVNFNRDEWGNVFKEKICRNYLYF